MMKIARVFARKTNQSPGDELAFYDVPGLFPPEVDEVHISVTFTYDLFKAEYLAREWKRIAPVKTGGPATGMKGEEFVPGMYLKKGITITSRGCIRRCWFCSVWKREGPIRELEIKDGWIVQDDNLLACSDSHIKQVFEMLKRQPHRAEFRGGLDVRLLKEWHVELLAELKPKRIYFSYDLPEEFDFLNPAGKMLQEVGFTKSSCSLRCYVLIGFPGDTLEQAEIRMWQVIDAGFFPMAMLYRNEKGETSPQWRKYQSGWVRPIIVGAKIKEHAT